MKDWTASTWKANMITLVESVLEGHKLLSVVVETARVVKDAGALQSQATSGERRKLTLAIGRALKQLKVPGNDFPRSLQTWAGEVLFNMTETSKGLNVTPSAALVARSGAHEWTLASFSLPLWFQDSSECIVKHAFADLIASYSGRVAGQVVKVHDKLTSQPEALRCVLGMRSGGAGHDTVQELKWVPEALKDCRPDSVCDHAHAWVMGGCQLTWRFDAHELPFNGSGAVIVVQRGSCVVLSWPMQPVVQAGSCVRDFATFVGNMAPADAGKWMSEHAEWAEVQDRRSQQ